ncbi:MAG TPA: signal peptide peptidase SppA [Pantanalinema sp.]
MTRTTSIALAAVLPLVATPVRAAVPTDMGMIPSAALVDDAAAIVVNPGALGASAGASAMLTRQGWASGTTRLLFNAGALGLGYTHDNSGAIPYNDYAMGLGFGLGERMRWGMTYHLPAEGRPWSYDLGLMTRPFNHLSLGLAVRNVFATPGALGMAGREYQLGAGFRPFGPGWTLSVDVPYADGTPVNLTTVQPFFGLDVQLRDGVRLRGQVSTSLAYTVGLSLNTAQLALGAMGNGNTVGTHLKVSSLRERSALGAAGGQWATLDLAEALGRGGADLPLIGSLSDVPPVYPALRALSEAQADPAIGALIVKVGRVGGGWATLEELRAGITRFKESGKPVWAYLEDADFRTYYLASAADRVFLNPMGTLELAGTSRTLTHFKSLLDNLGVKAQFVAVGRYKTAMEPFERTTPSPAQREQTQALLDDQFDRVVQAIAGSRKLPLDKVRQAIDQGMLEAPAAQAAGFVDELAHRDEVPKRLEQQLARRLTGVNALALRYRTVAWAPPRVAIVHAAGSIVDGTSGSDLVQGATLGSDTLVAALREVRDDDAVKAVVFRVDSPGGSAMASDVMRRELMLVAEKKKVVVSMGDVAASGGYWVSMIPGTPVYADPGTITGSIGVIVGKFSIDGLLAKWGITNTTLKRGAHADMLSPTRPFTPDEEAKLRANADFFYGRFVSLVAANRDLSEGRVRELGNGRVYTGAMAQRLGLVDRLAGLDEAIAEARRRAGLDGQEVKLAFYPEVNPFGAIGLGADGQLRLGNTLSLASELRQAADRLAPWARTGVWLLPPDFDQ